MSQRTIVEKADIAVSNLTTEGGYLNNEQSDAFIRMVQEQPTIIRICRTVRMNAPKRDIDKIGFATRILRAAPASGTPLAADERSKPSTSKLTMETKEVIAEVHIPYDVLEDNIERGGLEGTIMGMITERSAVDLEELIIQGDTTSTDSYLALFNGVLAKIVTHKVNQASVAISKTMFKNGLLQMPNKYLRNRSAMRHFISPDQETAYRDTLSNRQTGLGDTLIQGNPPVYAYGVPVEPVALMPNAYGFFTYPQNLIWGIQRQIMIETDKDIRARVLIIVVTMRCAFEIEEEDACVEYYGIATP
jgi:hypothetical protein